MTNKKAKIAVNFSYSGFVLDADKFVQLVELLRGAERFKTKWNSDGSTMHVYPPDGDDNVVELKYLTDEQYAMAKIAGKPTEP